MCSTLRTPYSFWICHSRCFTISFSNHTSQDYAVWLCWGHSWVFLDSCTQDLLILKLVSSRKTLWNYFISWREETFRILRKIFYHIQDRKYMSFFYPLLYRRYIYPVSSNFRKLRMIIPGWMWINMVSILGLRHGTVKWIVRCILVAQNS